MAFANFAGWLIAIRSELAIFVLPVSTRRDALKCVPVLGNLAALDAKEFVNTGWHAAEGSLCDDEDEVPPPRVMWALLNSYTRQPAPSRRKLAGLAM